MTKYPLIKKWKEKRKNLFEEFVHVVIVEIARAWHYDKNGLCSIEICGESIQCPICNAALILVAISNTISVLSDFNVISSTNKQYVIDKCKLQRQRGK